MYLRHLVDHRSGLPVYDPGTGSFDTWMGEADARRLIQEDKIVTKGPRKRPDRLEWAHAVTPKWRYGPRAEDQPGGKDVRQKLHYSFDHATKDNPENVWALVKLANEDDIVFVEVPAGCGAALIQRERKAVKCDPCNGSGLINPVQFGRLSVCRECGGRGRIFRYKETPLERTPQ